jgi:hypothetical protein
VVFLDLAIEQRPKPIRVKLLASFPIENNRPSATLGPLSYRPLNARLLLANSTVSVYIVQIFMCWLMRQRFYFCVPETTRANKGIGKQVQPLSTFKNGQRRVFFRILLFLFIIICSPKGLPKSLPWYIS